MARLFQQGNERSDCLLDLKMLLDAGASRISVVRSKSWLLQEPIERAGKGRRFARRNQHTVFFVHDQFGYPGQLRRNHRARRRHRFENYCGKNVAAATIIDG